MSGQYGFTKFGASAKAGLAAALSENTRQAAKISREVVSRAVSKVETRVREERTRRTMTKSVALTSHILENQSDRHQRGVYRWVDRVDRYQTFRYPDRLQLEFQIPEPGAYLRHRITQPRKNPGDLIEKPPAWTVGKDDITADGYLQLAAKYHAGGLPPPPDPTLSVAASLNEASTADPVVNNDVRWTAPTIQKTIEVTLPQGYCANSVEVSAAAMPTLANWFLEFFRTPANHTPVDLRGYHHITLTVAAGGSRLTHDQGGSDPTLNELAIQFNDHEEGHRANVLFGKAVLRDAHGVLPFSGPVVDKVSLGIVVAGAVSATVGFEIRCTLRPEALAEWKGTTYDALFDAWRAWDREFRQQQIVAPSPQLSDVDSGSGLLNKQLVQEELKRLVITWLVDDDDFGGVDAMGPGTTSGWDRYDIHKAQAVAPIVQFLSKPLSGNLTYVPYPYYWARASEWDELTEVRGADPEFVRFLRAGSVRVIVPARPLFERAVLNWLVYLVPFLGDPLPLPDDPLHVSVATEIKDLTSPIVGGEPGESWGILLPTSLLWLTLMRRCHRTPTDFLESHLMNRTSSVFASPGTALRRI